MTDRILRIFFGVLLGLSISLFVYSIFYEHYFFYLELPIYPFIGILIGFAMGWKGKIPPMKIWKSVLIFALLIIFTILYSKTRDNFLRSQRIQHAEVIASQYSSRVEILQIDYEKGNGMEVPPNVKLEFKTYNNGVEVENILDDFGFWQPEIQEVHKREKSVHNDGVVYSMMVDYRSIFYDLHKAMLTPVFSIIEYFF